VDAAVVPLRNKLAALAEAEGASVAPGEQTLKQVTVLFLDVVGSTAMGRELDPEDIHAVMDEALGALTSLVEAHGGRVLKYAGDSLLAVFGASDAREDDPERAVRAGLALLAGVPPLAEAFKARHGIAGFNVRVGIHTGPVLLGGGLDAEHNIRGSTVNVAARMEQSAPDGALRISHDTYRQVRGLFDVEAQRPIEVKGLDEPVLTYLVQRAKPRAFRRASRGIEGVETRMVGRDAELELLQDAFKRVFRERKLTVATVVADAGIGKSRLLYEFENWAEARSEAFSMFQGRAHPQTEGQPYGLLRDILAWRLQIGDSDSMEVAKQKVERGIAPLFDDDANMAQAHAHLLGHLIGLDFSESPHIKGIKSDSKQIRNRGFHAAAQMFRRIAARDGTPILLLLDDLHWADDGSLDFLNYLAQVNRDVPMLLLGLARPTLFERRSDWSNTVEAHQRIDLLPLDKGVSRLLANELLKKLDDVPSALRELVSGGAEGNPFYMEELVKMLVDEGAIETGGDRWRLIPGKLLATHVPQTLIGVLQARLDSLKSTERLALQHASIIGFIFWDRALAAIDGTATEALAGVTERELVIPHGEASLDGVREYAFKHQVLHQVIYDTVLKRVRRDCHAKVAAWLGGLTGSRANDFLGVAAKHFEDAGDNANASEFYTRAAEHARGRHAHEAVLEYVAKALALIGEDAKPESLLLRWRLLDVRERMLDLRGRRAEQQADIDALQQLADALDDDRRRGEVALRRSGIALHTADFRAMETAARQAMALADDTGADAVFKLRAQHHLATARNLLGDLAAGKALAQDGLAAARAGGLREMEGLFLSTLCFVAAAGDDLMATLEMNWQQLLIERELGDRRFEAGALIIVGSSWRNLGERPQARRHLKEGLRLTRAIGDRATEPYGLVNLSVLALWEGDDALALARARSALDIAVEIQDRRIEVGALCCLGNAEFALGRYAAAAAAFDSARAVALALSDQATACEAAAGLARVALAQGDVAVALQHVETVLAHLAGGGSLDATESSLIRLTCYQVLQHVGDARAAEVLADAHAQIQARAANITDTTLRNSFLNNIPSHRAIVSAWAARQVECTDGH